MPKLKLLLNTIKRFCVTHCRGKHCWTTQQCSFLTLSFLIRTGMTCLFVPGPFSERQAFRTRHLMWHHQGSLTHPRHYKRLEVREESLASLLNSLHESMKRIHTEKYAKWKIEAAMYYSKWFFKKKNLECNKGQHRPCWWHNRRAKTSLVQYLVFYLLISKFATSYSCAFCIEHCSCNKETADQRNCFAFPFIWQWRLFCLLGCVLVYAQGFIFLAICNLPLNPLLKDMVIEKQINKQLNFKCKWAMHVFWEH